MIVCSDNLSQTNEFMVPFISEDNLLSLFEKEVTYLVDIGGEHLPDVSGRFWPGFMILILFFCCCTCYSSFTGSYLT